jgi:hypothetical protein
MSTHLLLRSIVQGLVSGLLSQEHTCSVTYWRPDARDMPYYGIRLGAKCSSDSLEFPNAVLRTMAGEATVVPPETCSTLLKR